MRFFNLLLYTVISIGTAKDYKMKLLCFVMILMVKQTVVELQTPLSLGQLQANVMTQ